MILKKAFLLLASLTLLFNATARAQDATLAPDVRVENFNLKRSLALGGYDPVAYFNGGPEKGERSISHNYKGVTYRFASQANKDRFIENPASYEPAYGGWCAWAMYDGGGRTKPNPKSYKIVDGQLYVFYDGLFGDTLTLWNAALTSKEESELISTASRHWQGQVK